MNQQSAVLTSGASKGLARLVGVLFIIGTAAGIGSAALTGPLFDGADYLTQVAQNEGLVAASALLVLVMAFALAMIPVVLFPVFRRYSEAMALGAVVFRGVLEAVGYILIALSWLLIITVSREHPAGVDASATAVLLRGLEVWSVEILAIVFSIGALMVYWLFYVSRLIPRWLALWGLVGGGLYLLKPLFAMFGVESVGFLMMPLAVQEIVLAVWLIVIGFNSKSLPTSEFGQ